MESLALKSFIRTTKRVAHGKRILASASLISVISYREPNLSGDYCITLQDLMFSQHYL